MKQYNRPSLVEYGRLGELTLGSNGTLPDLLGNVVTNNSCPTGLDGTNVRVACLNAS